MEQLGEYASMLQTALIMKTRTDRVYSVPGDKREWRGPPLRPNIDYMGSNLNRLPRLLYGEGDLMMGMCQEIWDTVCDSVYSTRGEPAELSRIYFPHITFSLAPDASCLPQLMCAMAWSGEWAQRKFTVTKTECRLDFGPGILGLALDQRTVVHRGLRRRLPDGNDVNPLSLLSRPMGKARASAPDTTSLFRHLALTFPELTTTLNVIFSTAVHAGREFESVLTRQFDMIEVDDIATTTATVWVKARRVINTAVENPLPDLWAVLQGTWNLETFTALLGNPHRKSSTYSTAMRTKHARVIDLAESAQINLQVFKKVGPGQDAAEALLKFQSLMGSPV